jgi:hypothetical protein
VSELQELQPTEVLLMLLEKKLFIQLHNRQQKYASLRAVFFFCISGSSVATTRAGEKG